MNETATPNNSTERTFYLTELLDLPAFFNDRKVGKLHDLVAVDQGKLAEVTHFQIARPFGDAPLFVPFAQVRFFDAREIVVENGSIENYVRTLQLEEVLLRDYLLNKKVLDTEDREVEVVYDMRLVLSNNRMYVSDVDISRYGLLRQIGLRHLANYFYKRADEVKKKMIPWSYVQALPAQLDSLEGNLKLNILKEQLAEIHPADLADILEELDSHQRLKVLEQLDNEHASDALEEVDPAVQRDIVFSLPRERTAQLIGEMTPGQAADVLSVLPSTEKTAVLALLEPVKVAKIEDILKKHESNILNFTTHRFLKCPTDMTVKQARRKFRDSAKCLDVVMYFYIVDEKDELLGVIDIKELFMADDDERLKDMMTENVVSLNPQSTMKQAANAFIRYGFRALPVVDDKNILQGVVPYRDVMNLKHRILD